MTTILIILANIILQSQSLIHKIESVRGFLILLVLCIVFMFLMAYNQFNDPKNKR